MVICVILGIAGALLLGIRIVRLRKNGRSNRPSATGIIGLLLLTVALSAFLWLIPVKYLEPEPGTYSFKDTVSKQIMFKQIMLQMDVSQSMAGK